MRLCFHFSSLTRCMRAGLRKVGAFSRHFVTSTHGVSLVETAVALPILLLLAFGTIEVIRYININEKLNQATYKLANEIAAFPALSSEDLDSTLGLRKGVQQSLGEYMAPYAPSSRDRLWAYYVFTDSNNNQRRVSWAFPQGNGTPTCGSVFGAESKAATIPEVNGRQPDGIVVEGQFNFQPLFLDFVLPQITLRSSAVAVPRSDGIRVITGDSSNSIMCNGDTGGDLCSTNPDPQFCVCPNPSDPGSSCFDACKDPNIPLCTTNADGTTSPTPCCSDECARQPTPELQAQCRACEEDPAGEACVTFCSGLRTDATGAVNAPPEICAQKCRLKPLDDGAAGGPGFDPDFGPNTPPCGQVCGRFPQASPNPPRPSNVPALCEQVCTENNAGSLAYCAGLCNSPQAAQQFADPGVRAICNAECGVNRNLAACQPLCENDDSNRAQYCNDICAASGPNFSASCLRKFCPDSGPRAAWCPATPAPAQCCTQAEIDAGVPSTCCAQKNDAADPTRCVVNDTKPANCPCCTSADPSQCCEIRDASGQCVSNPSAPSSCTPVQCSTSSCVAPDGSQGCTSTVCDRQNGSCQQLGCVPPGQEQDCGSCYACGPGSSQPQLECPPEF